jgi:hypothetical protein
MGPVERAGAQLRETGKLRRRGREALAGVADSAQKARLEALLARANEQLADLQAQYDAWHAEIAARRQHTIDSAEEEMARPLPHQAE